MQLNGALGVGGLVLYVCFHERAKFTPPLDASQTNKAPNGKIFDLRDRSLTTGGVVAAKLGDGRELESGAQLARDRKLGDFFVREPADGQNLVGREHFDRLVELAAEDAMLLVVMQPIAEPYETGNAAAELLDELVPEAGFRFLGVSQPAAG